VDQIVTLGPTGNISGAVDAELAELANEIREVGKGAIIAIGERLIKAKKLAGHGNWLPWLKREFGWSERTARNYMAVAERSKSAIIADLNIDATALLQLTAPSMPAEVVAEVVKDVGALNRKITAKDVTRAKAAHKAHRAPTSSKPKSAKPAAEPIDVVKREIVDLCSDDKWRTRDKIATAVKRAPTIVRDALIALGTGVAQRRTGNEIEYRIVRDTEADMRSALALKDEEIARLKARVAELEAQLEQLTAPPAVATAPAMVVVR
jgi:hypothetical protein